MTKDIRPNYLSGAEGLVKLLDQHEVKYIFGLCGDTSLPFYDALYRLNHSIKHVLTRDERSASYMADGYARVTGKVGICEGPSGGGATYMIPGVVEANESSISVISITSDVPTTSIGHFPLTELNQKELFKPLTKWNEILNDPKKFCENIRKAFKESTSGRPGACHLSFPFDIQKASWLASQKKPVLLLSDCLGATKAGHTRSEAEIEAVFKNLLNQAKGLVLVTTVSSNILRIWQAISASVGCGRKVAFVGRSLESSGEIAQKLGYFKEFKNAIVPISKVRKMNPKRLTLIVAGSYGQEDSALRRISQRKHNLVKLRKEDTVIFSADPAPPQVLVAVNKMVDDLTRIGAKVFYYEIQDDLHASGHGTGEDIKMLFSLVKAKYLLPIGGDFRHMRAYQELGMKMGWKENEVLLLKEGEKVVVNKEGRVVVK